jgi:hypothetical protein
VIRKAKFEEKKSSVEMWETASPQNECKSVLVFYSEVFTSRVICGSHSADTETEAAVPLKLEKYLSWESRL